MTIMRLVRRKVFGGQESRGAAALFAESRRRVRSDEYIAWLCRILGGWLSRDHGNIAAFDHALNHLPANGAILEIGSFLGLSTNILAYLAMKRGVKNPFFSCDPWIFEGTEKPIGGYFDASHPRYRDYAKRVFVMNAETFSPDCRPFAVEAASEDFMRLWERGAETTDAFGRAARLGGPISFAYIDGDHTYAASKADFQAIDRHLLPGGFILFDDSADDAPFECKDVAREARQSGAYELVFTTPNYFFRKNRAQ